QHRLFLETAWQALENAGYDSAQYDGDIGVFGGASTSAYLENIFSNLEQGAALKGENVGLGFELSFLASRVSHKLDLKGPSLPVQTACSTSLVAVHLACQSLLNYECDMALSGAVSYKGGADQGYVHREGSFLSPDGHVRPFDATARGTVFGSGVGVVVLTAPTVAGQARVVTEAMNVAEVRPQDIDYVEGHGSGTLIGDSIEFQALERALEGGSCTVGSVKGNVGHLDAAAG
ncbi:polyketide synthase, partial [Streptomyces sp. NRRL S-1022]|uniref:beta-ketoacyl [acyl carrier protein] synthase domain-containing protein n=1 Tax=Streptomyces sp. NRRL S-1022 TaxID=1463880 RepID=UPI0004C26FC6